MTRIRVIPVLLLQDGALVKTIKFRDSKYVGDPINAVKIFNEKEVDEIIILDISAHARKRPPNVNMVRDTVSESFMPACYGGGVSSVQEIGNILRLGVEKVSMNSVVTVDPDVIRRAAETFGSQSIVVSIDAKKGRLGSYRVYTQGGRVNTGRNPVEFAKDVEKMGAGEILLTSIDRDGSYKGYDVELIRMVSSEVSIPIVACGGARNVDDFSAAVEAGASAVAAGSMFVFHGIHRAVLINFPSQTELKEKLFSLQ